MDAKETERRKMIGEIGVLRETYASCIETMRHLGHRIPVALAVAVESGSLVHARKMLDHVLAHHGLLRKAASWRALEAIAEECRKGDGEDGKRVCLYSHEGDLLGRHTSQADAYAQEAAIRANQ